MRGGVRHGHAHSAGRHPDAAVTRMGPFSGRLPAFSRSDPYLFFLLFPPVAAPTLHEKRPILAEDRAFPVCGAPDVYTSGIV